MSRRAKITTWVIVLLVLFGGGGFYVLNQYYGWFKLGADAIIGCQRTSDINAFFGSPGRNLTQYDFFGQTVTVNQKIVPFLDNVQNEIKLANTGYTFDRIDGFNNRWKAGGGGRSLHSWGIALDINPQRNPYQLGKWEEADTDIPSKIIDIMKSQGFAWGGDWPGERDPMHFEWYGAELQGNILDQNTGQKILDVAAWVDGAEAPLGKDSYYWVLPATSHSVRLVARGYEDANFSLELFCFESRTLDITMKPLADNIAGRISGRVSLADGSPMLLPATIFLDDKIVGASNVLGDYLITGVRRGTHKITAKIGLYPGTSRQTIELVPGDDIKDFDIVIGNP